MSMARETFHVWVGNFERLWATQPVKLSSAALPSTWTWARAPPWEPSTVRPQACDRFGVWSRRRPSTKAAGSVGRAPVVDRDPQAETGHGVHRGRRAVVQPGRAGAKAGVEQNAVACGVANEARG